MIAEVYIITEGPAGPVKIGRSVSARTRLASLQTGNSRRLTIVASYALSSDEAVVAEQYLHDELKYAALVGEWFNLSVDFMQRYMPDFFLANGFEVRQ